MNQTAPLSVYVWVLAPDKTVSRYTMTIEIVYHISKD